MVDASLMTAWLVNEPALTRDFDITEILADTAIFVPSHWPVEISNALRTKLRSGQLGPSDFHAMIDQLDLLQIQTEPPIELDEIGPLAQFALTHDLTAYDAAYVQLALVRNATLATLDVAMRAAAQRLSIPVLPAAPPA